jgi:hypothetical protein
VQRSALSYEIRVGVRCSVVVKALCYKPKGRGFETRLAEWPPRPVTGIALFYLLRTDTAQSFPNDFQFKISESSSHSTLHILHTAIPSRNRQLKHVEEVSMFQSLLKHLTFKHWISETAVLRAGRSLFKCPLLLCQFLLQRFH